MFARRLTELPPIKEAVATYMMRASEKLRSQGSLCKKLRVSIRTGMFNPDEAKFANGVVVDLPYPTDDVRLLTKAAVDALDRVFRPGFNYSKAEALLLNLCQPGEYTDDLFAINQPADASRVMTVLDQSWGRGDAAISQRALKPGLGDAPRDDESKLHYAAGAAVDGALQVNNPMAPPWAAAAAYWGRCCMIITSIS